MVLLQSFEGRCRLTAGRYQVLSAQIGKGWRQCSQQRECTLHNQHSLYVFCSLKGRYIYYIMTYQVNATITIIIATVPCVIIATSNSTGLFAPRVCSFLELGHGRKIDLVQHFFWEIWWWRWPVISNNIYFAWVTWQLRPLDHVKGKLHRIGGAFLLGGGHGSWWEVVAEPQAAER